MKHVNVHEAKIHFSKLMDAAMAGEEIVIAKAGKPAAKLVPYRTETRKTIRFGGMKGEIEIAEDFDTPLPDEIAAAFEGGGREMAARHSCAPVSIGRWCCLIQFGACRYRSDRCGLCKCGFDMGNQHQISSGKAQDRSALSAGSSD